MKLKFARIPNRCRLPLVLGRQLPVMVFALVIQVLFSGFNTSREATRFAPANPGSNVQDPTPEWLLYGSVRKVDFYYRISDCSGKKVVFLKLNNRNAQPVKVSWKEVFTTQFEEQREGFKGTKQLVLATGESAEISCTNNKIKELVVLPRQVSATYEAEIKKFTFKDISVVDM